jgi:DNA polymerase V
MFGLVDGNNFYASCERAFKPELQGVPVCVLSNNDGCVIARSQECKNLGIGMGQPIHQVPPALRRQLRIFSANFALYGDLSGRVVSILRDQFDRVEVYSIDESFVDFQGIRAERREQVAAEVRARIRQWVGIPCCVGIGPTKTLAKLANKLAKKTPHGVVTGLPGDAVLERFPVEDVWGVGRRLTARLGAEGILTAADLCRADPETLRTRYGVTLARTQRELQGIACTNLEESEPDRKQIVVSRSFGREVVALEDLQQAVATFAQRACEKLRARSLQANGVWVWCNTNPFKPDAPQYHPSGAMPLIAPTSDTREVLRLAQHLGRAMFRQGYRYKKAGVGLLDLTHGDHQQADLFAQADPRSKRLMEVMDRANARFGRGAMGLASSALRPRKGTLERPVWGMNQAAMSGRYTTSWGELAVTR